MRMSAMAKEGDTSGGIKVFESRRKNQRRLVMSSDSDADEDELVVSPLAKDEGVTGNSNTGSEMHSVVAEKGGAEETAESREVLKRRLGIDGSDVKDWETRSDSVKREIDSDQPGGKKMKSEFGDSLGSQRGRSGGINRRLESLKRKDKFMECNNEKSVFLKSDRKRSMENGDDEFNRKKLKPEHVESFDNQNKEIGGSNKNLNIAKSRGNSMASHENSFHGSRRSMKCRDEYDLMKRKSRQSLNMDGKLQEEKPRLGRPGRGELRKLKDTSVFDADSKKEDACGSSQFSYIRMQGKSGVLRVLRNSKKFGSVESNSSAECEMQGNRRRLRSSDKFDRSNPQLEKKLGEKASSTTRVGRSTGRISSSDKVKSNEAHVKQASLPQQKGSKNEDLLHGKSAKMAKENFNSEMPNLSRSEAKHKLREQIKNILLGAGWTIDLRPRRGRDYEDAVYVSPQGSGYWSITKAYDVYIAQTRRTYDDMEDLGKPSNGSAGRLSNCREASSTVAIIPPDVLVMLKRNVVNKRKQKKEVKEAKHKVGPSRKKMAKENNRVKLHKDRVREDVGGTKALKRKVIIRNVKRKGCALLVRGSNQDEGTVNGNYTPYVWKRTILSWMIDLGVLPAYGKVRYMNKRMTKTLLDGRITRDGIQCSCCSKILTVSKFEVHAGSKVHQPYENIYIEASGVSLLQCQVKAWDKQESKRHSFFDVDTEGDDPNDDTCGICGDGGDLICCDGCPSTFHLGCLNIQMLPAGDWHCSNCSCKFCGAVSDSASQDGSPSDSLFTCSQCDRKYHKCCVADEDAMCASPNSSNMFCGQSCRKIFKQLQKLTGLKNELEGGFSWSIVRRFENPSKIPSRESLRVESNSKVAVAYAVMDECFVPIIDQRSGINLINNVVYNCGSNFNRLNFSGFYTFILERGDEITAAASVRIHDTKLAEMPFIGTRVMYRRQGMCRQLLEGIESALRSLKVEKLIIPAISELKDTWTTVFGFKPLGISQKQEVKSINILVFPGTGLLLKPLLRNSSRQDANCEPGNTSDPVITSKANSSYSDEETINSKEPKCDAEKEDVAPILGSNCSNFVPEADGVLAPVCSALVSVVDCESNDLKDIGHNNCHVEGDISHIKCSTKVSARMEEANNEAEEITKGNCRSFLEPYVFESFETMTSDNDSNLEYATVEAIKKSNSMAEGECLQGSLSEVKTNLLSNGTVNDAVSKTYEHSKANEDTIDANDEAKLWENINGIESILNDVSSERHVHNEASENTMHENEEFELRQNGNGLEPPFIGVSSERYGHTESCEGPKNGDDEVKNQFGADVLESNVNDEGIAVSLDV
ncbi:hypothetical protein HPP92_001907 [Vanilla planifolia]|uniref:Uncharacterized protein n=1 Tax=Vanilla planifolia TaxID=51239 RepID=A0A835VHZ4_VANPL|nr:hypothetical protein HPP92_001907 [Vanilla planifolia]